MTSEAVQCDDAVAESVNGATNRSSGTGLASLWREETLNHRIQPALAAWRLDRVRNHGQTSSPARPGIPALQPTAGRSVRLRLLGKLADKVQLRSNDLWFLAAMCPVVCKCCLNVALGQLPDARHNVI